MAEEFAFMIAQSLLEKLGSLALEELFLASGVKSEARKIEDTLSVIKAVLLDAEEKQEKNHQVREWLTQLKAILHDAEVALDEFEVEALRQRVPNRSAVVKVRRFFSCSPLTFRCKMGRKFKEIRENIVWANSLQKDFHFEELKDWRTESIRDEADYFRGTSHCIGRDDDRKKIINLLMRPNHDEHVSIVSIVGAGGLGKSTLADVVYNDERVVEKFQLRVWNDCNHQCWEQLKARLRDTLSAKRFLLVLDDVWKEVVRKWDDMKHWLMSGAYGSMIIVTTRDQSVSSATAPTFTHYLKGLSGENSLALLIKWAFGEGHKEKYQSLLGIGKEIVNKCKGVPLDIRTIGSLLYMKTEKDDWLSANNSDTWDSVQTEVNVTPALKLSYKLLPSYLKPCFAICSIFPKGHLFYSTELIYLWMGLGLIRKNQNSELEDIGYGYLRELWSTSFFQDVEEEVFYYRFKMHDVLHDLALWVTRSECSIVTNVDSLEVPEKVRHAYINSSVRENVQEFLKAKNLQTIKVFQEVAPTYSKSFLETSISRFKLLRVLDIKYSAFESLPSSIGSLKHLRYLDLSGNRRIKSLPNSVCKLQSLQTLEFVGCVGLEKLPKDFGNLISLRYLSLTTHESSLPSKAFRSLTSLRSLMIVGCPNLEYLFDNGTGSQQSLTTLRALYIENCTSLVSLPKVIRDLGKLKNLFISSCENLNLIMEEEEGGTQGGGGLRSLQFLGIERLPKVVALPRWLLSEAAGTLRRLRIVECPELQSLPVRMNYLIQLKGPHISNCPKLIIR
ncbi:hypothetical protein RJ640_010791 [Escallonia rubra]|uniref:Uncharacterized protein n=1 Tax=Escallonia rubra TaxID=112253 RepID=A0AA88QVK6_9ASTE|nr:hypothetical protein RJ640_010791 [Escallonia rubra]